MLIWPSSKPAAKIECYGEKANLKTLDSVSTSLTKPISNTLIEASSPPDTIFLFMKITLSTKSV